MVAGGLLTGGLIVGADVVADTDGDGVLALLQRLGDVEGEGHVAADMVAHIGAVDPQLGVVVAGADVEQDTLVRLGGPALREGQGLTVPDALAKILVTDARKLALAAEGDGDGLGEGGSVLEASLLAGESAVGLILPNTVEVEPILVATVKLRTGELGAGSVVGIKHRFSLTLHKI